MIQARPKYPTGLYGTFYIDSIQKAVFICLIIPTTFPFDAVSRVDNVRHTSGYFFMLNPTIHEFTRVTLIICQSITKTFTPYVRVMI